MKLSALLLTVLIALGLSSPLEARHKSKVPKVKHPPTSYKAPKRKSKPAKMKPMKFHKAKHASNSHRVKPARKHKGPAARSV
jgi:hypothetical protein